MGFKETINYFLLAGLILIVVILSTLYYNIRQDQQYSFYKPCSVSPYLVEEAEEDSFGVQFVLAPKYLWKGRRDIKVCFLDANGELIKNTLDIANQWLSASKSKFVKEEELGESDIRVTFRRGGGYSSLIGNEAEGFKYIGLPTMWLENLDKEESFVFNRTVLHEFGHALGLLHELKNPNAKFDWNIDETMLYFRTLKWEDSEIKKNILDPPPHTVISSSYDPYSIMNYQIPKKLLNSGDGMIWPKGLSKTDRVEIKKYY